MFAGQGAQYFQMGKDLYEHNAVFRREFDHGEAIVRDLCGRSLSAEIYERNRAEAFDDLALSHAALIVIELAVCRTLEVAGIVPDEVWGTSLGEYVAGVVAGSWTLDASLHAVVTQARLVGEQCPAGGMLAVLGAPSLFDDLRRADVDITLAGINFQQHFTLAGSHAALADAERVLLATGATFQRLPVRFAFHSAAIDGMREAYVRYCGEHVFRPARVRMTSGIDGRDLSQLSASYLWEVIRQPMRFAETWALLERRGPHIYVDCSPSGTLATFGKYNLGASSSQVFPILTPFNQGMQNLERLRAHVHGG